MPKEIIPRTAVKPDGGVCRIAPRPAIDITCIEILDSPIRLWAQTWGGLVVKQFKEELEKIKPPPAVHASEQMSLAEQLERLGEARANNASLPLLLKDHPDARVAFKRPAAQANYQAKLQGTLQFMWDAMPSEMRAQIIERYHPNNFLAKEEP